MNTIDKIKEYDENNKLISIKNSEGAVLWTIEADIWFKTLGEGKQWHIAHLVSNDDVVRKVFPSKGTETN